jgi:hypothetical protein
VFKAITHGLFEDDARDIGEYVRVAALNKVLLHFLRVAGVNDRVRVREEARFRVFLARLEEVAGALDGLRFAFFKARKPVVYVPSDIDVLIDRDHVGAAVRRLRGLGFRVEVSEPYCVTLTRGGAIVDLYVNPSLGSVVYLDGGRLLEYVVNGSVYGVSAPVLSDEAELVVVVAHAVYKERLYTLNDYVTFRSLYSGRALDLARELSVYRAFEEAFRVHELVDKGVLALPYRIPLARWVALLGSKFIGDRLTRSTAINVIGTLRDRRFGDLVLSKFLRDTY